MVEYLVEVEDCTKNCRITRDVLCNLLPPHFTKMPTRMRKPASVKKQLGIFLRHLSHKGKNRKTDKAFGVSCSLLSFLMVSFIYSRMLLLSNILDLLSS